MILLTTDDFSGFHGIATNPASLPLLQEYIDRFEQSYIMRILGVELGTKFIADIKGEDSDSSALEDRFEVIFNPFIKQDYCRHIMESKGMKDVLAALVFYEFISSTQAKSSQAGVITNQAEVSNIASPENAARFGEVKWNSALSSIEAIQWWCGVKDHANYPEYEGTYFRPKYSPLL